MDSILHHLTFLRKTAEGLPHGKKFIEEAESKTGQKIENIFAGLEVVLALMVFWGFGASLIVNLVGFAYPGIATMLALESPEKEDDKKWLIYWIIFSLSYSIDFNFHAPNPMPINGLLEKCVIPCL